MKRLFDIIASGCGLIVLSPFFLILAIWVKLDSEGPVFYRQERLGRNGEKSRVWKFRSMYADADKRLDDLLSSDSSLKAEFERGFKLKNEDN